MRPSTQNPRFAICLSAKQEEDLQVGKVYRVLPSTKASEAGCLRVIDESGEDYLYSASRFVVIDIPEKVRDRLLEAVRTEAGAKKR